MISSNHLRDPKLLKQLITKPKGGVKVGQKAILIYGLRQSFNSALNLFGMFSGYYRKQGNEVSVFLVIKKHFSKASIA